MELKINISPDLEKKLSIEDLAVIEEKFNSIFKSVDEKCILVLDLKINPKKKDIEVNIFIPPEINSKLDTKLRAFLISLQTILKSKLSNLPYGVTLDFQCLKAVENIKNLENASIEFKACEPIYTLENVVLPEETFKEIYNTAIFLKKKDILYHKWGFINIEPKPRLLLNFYGPPGTGKTITAHALANLLNMKILIANYAAIESKYVGEAPKKLVKLFEDAEKQNAIIFFDEADVFLGKRLSNIDSTADQETNALKSQLLVLLENFEGIAIFATNFIKNYDEAFKSRIYKHIYFPLPNKKLRKQIIKKLIPPKAPLAFPLEENYLEILSLISEGFSGRDIKNTIKETLIKALVEEKIPIPFDLFKETFLKYKSKIKIDKNKNSTESEKSVYVDLEKL